MELKHFGMRVSFVAPGAIESKIWDKAANYKEKYKKNTDPQLLKLYEFFTSSLSDLVLLKLFLDIFLLFEERMRRISSIFNN